MEENQELGEGKPSRAGIHPGSTTQGGSNFGQGSSHLGKEAVRQGSEKTTGSGYENEEGWDNEALRSEDILLNTNNQKTPPPEENH